VGKARKGKGTKCMVLVDGQGVPLGVHLSAATPAEHSLALATLEGRVTERLPERIVADKGYDARSLWEAMKARGIDEHKLENFLAFLHLACALIALRKLA